MVEDEGIGTIEEFASARFEVFGGRIEDGEVEIGAQKLEDAVRFEDDVVSRGKALAKCGHGFGEPSLLGADPEDAVGASGEKA